MGRTLVPILFMATVLIHSAPLQAQTPSPTTRLVPFAGVLTDSTGTPLSGAQEITFRLFDQSEGGIELWSETQTITADDRGRYLAYLGTALALPIDIFSTEQARWLQVSIGGRDLPRAMLVAVPYALKAADADTLGGRAATSYVTTGPGGRLQRADGAAVDAAAVDGTGVPGQIAKWSTPTTLSSSVISESFTNRVGIGLPDPTGGGVVDAQFTVRNVDNNTGIAILNQASQRAFALNTLAGGAWELYDGAGGSWNLGIRQTGGRVFVGHVSETDARFNVKATIDGIWAEAPSFGWAIRGFVSGGSGGFGVRGEGNNGVGVLATAVGGTALVANSTAGANIATFTGPGNVGIGTPTPADKLHVAGDVRVGSGPLGCVKDGDGDVIAGTCSSDLRFKQNVTAFGRSLDAVARLQPVYFHWRADEFPERHFGHMRSFGLVAQQVEEVLPELVATDDKGYKAVKYSQLPMHMLQAIGDLKAENDDLKTEAGALKTQNDELRQQIQTLEERLRRLEAIVMK